MHFEGLRRSERNCLIPMLDFDGGGVGRVPRDTRLFVPESLLPLPAPKPVDALRQHTRAVVLISADGEASPALLDAIRDSEIPCELIGHPVIAMAELVRLEKDNRHYTERTALFVADDERIEQLSSLFASVRARLPQVAIWVIAGEFAVQVQRATVQDLGASPTSPTPSAPPAGLAPSPRTRSHSGPVLRIVDHADEPMDATNAHATTVTAVPDRTDPLRTDHAIEVKSTESAARATRGENPELDGGDPPSDPDGETHSTKLTAEELDMLLGWDEQDAPERGTSDGSSGGGGRR